MACVLFNEKGKIKKICKLKKNDIFRTPINVFHTMQPLKNFVIYHESKTGPFLKKNDSIFSSWSKELVKNKTKINNLKKIIYKSIN
jgi:cupin fold WbuC family metalloprotein